MLQVVMVADESFGPRLRRERREQGLTLRELARRVGVDYTYLSKLENGRLPPPSDDAIARLAAALEVDPDDLFAVARKVPTNLRRQVKEGPPETALLLRRLSRAHLTPEQYSRIMQILQEGSLDHPDEESDGA